MTELWFYHLERASVDEALPALLSKLVERGGRAVVCSPEESRIDALDARLWTFRDDSFLPHGRADGPDAPRHPILLAAEPRNVNQASMLFCLDGAEPGDMDGWERVVVMFEADDEAGVQQARELWKTSKEAGIPVSYWRQSAEGRWEKKA